MNKGKERVRPEVCVIWFSVLALVLMAIGCGTSTHSSPSISIMLSSSTVLTLQDGTPASVNVMIDRPVGNTNSVTLTATGQPSGLQVQFVQPGTGTLGTVTAISSASVPAGTYSLNISANGDGLTASQPLSVVVGIVSAVGSTVDVSLGVGGQLQQFTSTSFSLGDATPSDNSDLSALNALESKHLRIQAGSPMQSNTGQSSDWNFTALDRMVQPILAVGDNSPQIEITMAPLFLSVPNSTNAEGQQFVFNTTNLNIFAQYCANLVRYYNKGGFDWGGQHFQSPSSHPITWWAIFNEYNINGLTPAQYVQLYNTVVPAMQAVDSTIKFIALELSTFNSQYCTSHNLPFNCTNGDPHNNLPTFVAPASNGGVNAQVDAISLHLYTSCDYKDTDAEVFSQVPLANQLGVSYFYQELATRPDLAKVPVWVTETNVNADYDRGDGSSICTGLPFYEDPRGTSAFSAAWGPYMFSQIGKAGNQAYVHFDYEANFNAVQYAMVGRNSNYKYISYWVEYWLAHKFPWNGVSPGPSILTLNATETSTVETLAIKNSDGSLVVMIANHAVNSSTDDNGPGAPRTMVVDVSSLGTFTAASELTIDANIDLVNGPGETAITPAQRIPVTLSGYGVTFVTLTP